MDAFDPARLERLRATLAGFTDRGEVTGLAWGLARGTQVEFGTSGVHTAGDDRAVGRDSLFRIASMTKPIVAVAALQLVEEGRLRLGDPVDDLLPELADRRVLVDPTGPMDGATVPAERPITLEDILTFRLGFGMDFDEPWPQPFVEACAEVGIGGGAPSPAGVPGPDEWIARLATLPNLRQPGERWLYNIGYDVLGVLVARADGRPLDEVLRARVLDPLGMDDTAFFAADTERLVTAYSGSDPTDGPDGQWSVPPPFPSGSGGLVSTIVDTVAFGRALLADGAGILARTTVAAMTSDALRPGQGGPGPDSGWGYGVGVARRRDGVARSAGSYGWDGGLGTSWANDPAEGLVGVILTNHEFTGPHLAPAVIRDFWTLAYAALV